METGGGSGEETERRQGTVLCPPACLQSRINHHQRADLLRVLDVDVMVRATLVDLQAFSPCAERGKGQFLPVGTAARQKRHGRKQGSIPDMAAVQGSPQVGVGVQDLPVKEQEVQFVAGCQTSYCLIDDPAALLCGQLRTRMATCCLLIFSSLPCAAVQSKVPRESDPEDPHRTGLRFPDQYESRSNGYLQALHSPLRHRMSS